MAAVASVVVSSVERLRTVWMTSTDVFAEEERSLGLCLRAVFLVSFDRFGDWFDSKHCVPFMNCCVLATITNSLMLSVNKS